MAIREGFHTVTPYIITQDLDGLVAFMKRALGAVETSFLAPVDGPDGERRAGTRDPFGNERHFGKPRK